MNSKKMIETISRKRKRLILIRYIAPMALILLLTAALFVPSVTGYIKSNETYEENSVASLAKNTWDTVRRYLFSSDVTEKNNVTETFSKEAFAAIIVFSSLFMLGALATFLTSAMAVKILFFPPDGKKSDGEMSRVRALFLTLIPNRGVLVLLHSLMLPALFFPIYLSKLYSSRLIGDSLSVSYEIFYPHIYGTVLFLGLVVLIFASKKAERREKLDIFSKGGTKN